MKPIIDKCCVQLHLQLERGWQLLGHISHKYRGSSHPFILTKCVLFKYGIMEYLVDLDLFDRFLFHYKLLVLEDSKLNLCKLHIHVVYWEMEKKMYFKTCMWKDSGICLAFLGLRLYFLMPRNFKQIIFSYAK